MNSKQYVQIENIKSEDITINVGCPHGCVLSPVLYTMYTDDCRSNDMSVPLIKFADDCTLQGLIFTSKESYRRVVLDFSCWCKNNHLHLNTHKKKKELIIDFRKKKTGLGPPSGQKCK